jgi:hypothetical protein
MLACALQTLGRASKQDLAFPATEDVAARSRRVRPPIGLRRLCCEKLSRNALRDGAGKGSPRMLVAGLWAHPSSLRSGSVLRV